MCLLATSGGDVITFPSARGQRNEYFLARVVPRVRHTRVFVKFKSSCTVSLIHEIKTHDSESRGEEEAGRTQRMSVLFTGSTAVKFVNALNKPPLKLSLSYQPDSARSNYIESVTQQWRKSAPPILSNSQCEFNGAVRAPTLEKPSPWHPFTRLLNK